MTIENVSTLKIHNLTQQQYDREAIAGNLKENELYLTPAPNIDLSPTENSNNLITSGAVYNALKNYSPNNPGGGAVTSVNGKIGAVEITAEDVGALPASTTTIENANSINGYKIRFSSTPPSDEEISSGIVDEYTLTFVI